MSSSIRRAVWSPAPAVNDAPAKNSMVNVAAYAKRAAGRRRVT
jgi:hypothetical protein